MHSLPELRPCAYAPAQELSPHSTREQPGGGAVARSAAVPLLGGSLDRLNLREFEVEEFRSIVRESMGQRPASDVELAVLDGLEALAPPSNNMGVTYPFTPYYFPHCEKSGVNSVQKASIDWLAYSSTCDLEALHLGLQVVWPSMLMSTSKTGMRGYSQTKVLTVEGVQYGLIGFGQAHGRASVSLTGTACKTLTPELVELLHEMLLVVDARLSRVDLAFDFYRGECTWDYAYHCFKKGEFKKPKATQNPSHSWVGGQGPNGENLGRTLYIGPRAGELYGRVYEKGLEVFAKMGEEFREQCTERELSLSGEAVASESVGTTIADTWVRLEAEFKRKHKERPIPLAMLLERDAYFAGAYPFFARMLGQGEGKGRGLIPSDKEFAHEKLLAAHRASYGNHLHTLRKIGFTDTEILDMLDTGLHNQKLLKSGLIDIETSAVRVFRAESQDADIPF